MFRNLPFSPSLSFLLSFSLLFFSPPRNVTLLLTLAGFSLLSRSCLHFDNITCREQTKCSLSILKEKYGTKLHISLLQFYVSVFQNAK